MSRSLEVRLLHYFLLITLAALLIGVEFYFEMNRLEQAQQLCITGDHDPEILQGLRNKIVIMFGMLTLVVAVVLTMFIRNITQPLRRIIDATQLINQGDLSQLIETHSNDEIGQVGQTINDLTSNLQEVAAFASATSEEIGSRLDQLGERLAQQSVPEPEELQQIRDNLQTMQGFVNSFKFFD